jgi:ribosomal protein S18 acetylase RimI-like enzyme
MRDLTSEIRILKDNHTEIAHGRMTDGCIHDVDVHPEYRRCGHGTEIVSRLIDMGGRYLWVASDNQPAVELYLSLGFHIEQESNGYYKMSLS